ncbi:MAG: glucose-6-phosphate isomerase [Rhodothermales bacterium]|nr:glucose-6-phosphate isomerase [Rhodothermales bacterium]
MLELNRNNLSPFVAAEEYEVLHPRLVAAHQSLLQKSGAGNNYLGWRDLLGSSASALLEELESTAAEIRERADVLVCIGIGGSYLGAQAVIAALTPHLTRPEGSPEILFAGHHLSGSYHQELLRYLEGKSVYVNVISKSGTTLEPAIAFRLLRNWMHDTFEDADRRIIVTTDPDRGKLNELRDVHGYRRYVIPADVGGRFSVLTPVGLLPIAAAGVDIRALFRGAVEMCDLLVTNEDNVALEYAAARYLLHEKGYSVDALAVLEPRLYGIARWWQQLFGESEGKNHRGLFPVMVQYTTDLHSIGQYMQDGQRRVIETFLMERQVSDTLVVPEVDGPPDGLEYLTGQRLSAVNQKAYEGTARAHLNGGVPNMTITIDSLEAVSIGRLIYFFEHAVAVGGYLLGVNPFDQPGVEDYKAEMYKLLGRS